MADRKFRPSCTKKDPRLQALPTNFLYQISQVRSHSADCQQPHDVDTLLNVSSGCFSPHALGHKANESNYVAEKAIYSDRINLEISKSSADSRNRTISSNLSSHVSIAQKLLLSPRVDLANQVSSIDLRMTLNAKRRLLSISQALSVAVNVVLMKINLVGDGAVDPQTAVRYVQPGPAISIPYTINT